MAGLGLGDRRVPGREPWLGDPGNRASARGYALRKAAMAWPGNHRRSTLFERRFSDDAVQPVVTPGCGSGGERVPMIRHQLIASVLLLLLAPPAYAAQCGGDFRSFTARMSHEALAAGI